MYKIYFPSIICFFTLTNCGYHRISKDKFGEPNVNKNAQYNFVEIPTENDFQKIDTTAYYIQVFEGRYYNESEKKNPQIIIFHNDGFFKKESFLHLGKEDKHRTKKSIYYGGKYRIKESIIEFEEFFPSRGGRTNYYVRNISKGRIEGNKLFLDYNFGWFVFEKKTKNALKTAYNIGLTKARQTEKK